MNVLNKEGERNLWNLIKEIKTIKLNTIDAIDITDPETILYHIALICRDRLCKDRLFRTKIVMIRYNQSKITFRTLKNHTIYPDIDVKNFEEEKEKKRLLLISLYDDNSWFFKENFHFDIFKEIYKLI